MWNTKFDAHLHQISQVSDVLKPYLKFGDFNNLGRKLSSC